MKKISTLLLCIVLAAALALAATAVGCKSSGTDKPNENQGDNDMNNDKIIATIEMENGGVMKLELYPEIAPQSVYNFVSLARSGFYDGLTFHRIIPGFMIQGGDPLGEGHGGPGYSIKGEFASNGFNNTLKHERGVISWARLSNPDSAGSQFFIMHAAAPHNGFNLLFSFKSAFVNVQRSIFAFIAHHQTAPHQTFLIMCMSGCRAFS